LIIFIFLAQDDGSSNDKTINSVEVAAINIERPSVIRTLDSPTFNEIRDRFKGEPSPVNNLQQWVNGCFESDSTEVTHEYPQELTPPSTPIESKVTTFTSQKLFEAFDAAKIVKNKDSNTPPPSLKGDISPVVIFSSKQPVLSTRELTTVSTSVIDIPKLIPGVITPQPSPKNESEFFHIKSKDIPKMNSTLQVNEPVNLTTQTRIITKPDPVR